MVNRSVLQRYSKLSMTLHWLMVALFIGVYGCVQIKGLLPRGDSARQLFLGMHALFGLAIFALVWLRLLARLQPRPPILPAPSGWQVGVSHLMHLALYGLMIATPILGWLMLAAGDKPVPYFGLVLPAPIAIDSALVRQLKHWHELIGSAGYWLIGLHTVAGLFHHYWVGDNTLKRMLPR